MSDIKAMFEVDFQSAILAIVTVMIGVIALRKIFVEFCGWLGLETKYMRRTREEKEDIDQLKKNNIYQDKKIDSIVESITRIEGSVGELSNKVSALQEKNDNAERNRLRDRIGQAYRYYRERGQWNSMEKEAFNGLIESYEAANGTNGFVHDKCIPESLLWKVIDD